MSPMVLGTHSWFVPKNLTTSLAAKHQRGRRPQIAESQRTERSRTDDTQGAKPQAQVQRKTQTAVMGKGPRSMGSRKLRARTWIPTIVGDLP